MSESAERRSATGAANILIVDDLPDQREIYRVILEHAGMQVLEAPDGHTAVALARAKVPDLVLLDVCLPDVDGFEVMRRLRAESRTRRIPVVLLTASSVPAGQNGFVELLTKPVPPRDALEAVSRQLARRGD